MAPGERLEREEEREADLAALVDPPEPRAVGEELALVRLEDDGLVVVGHQRRDEPRLRHQPLLELLLGALDDPERHAALRDVASDLAFLANGSLYGSQGERP